MEISICSLSLFDRKEQCGGSIITMLLHLHHPLAPTWRTEGLRGRAAIPRLARALLLCDPMLNQNILLNRPT